MSPGRNAGAPPPSYYGGSGAPSFITSTQVREITFPRKRGVEGYQPDQVDAFLARIADALAGIAPLHPEEVRRVSFDLVSGGYNKRAVDELLNRTEIQLRQRFVPPTRLRTGADLLNIKLPRGANGYDRSEVEAFLARAAATLDGRGKVTVNEVHNTRFSLTSGWHLGYQIRAIDALLDEIEQELRFRGR